MKKMQSAMEYLTTYGWAILVIAIVLALLYELGLFSPSTYVHTSCVLEADFGCLSSAMATNGLLTINIQQSTEGTINVTSIGCNEQPSTSHMVAFSPPYTVPIGGNQTFQVQCYVNNTAPYSGNIGDLYTGYIEMNYTDIQSGFPHSLTGEIQEKIVTRSS